MSGRGGAIMGSGAAIRGPARARPDDPARAAHPTGHRGTKADAGTDR